MIRAIVFDCFGVLASEGWLPFKRRHFGHSEELGRQATALAREANAGRISYEDFVSGVARLAGITAAQMDREIRSNEPDEQLFAFMATLKPRYKLGMLSNAAGNWLTRMFTAEQLALLDAVALSYETGYIKPEPPAYEVIAQRLGVSVGECLMVDDQPRFCQAARDAGMHALAYVDAAQFERELPGVLKAG